MSNMSEIADVKSSVNGKKDAEKYFGNKKFWISLLVNLFMVTASCYALNWLHPRVNKYFDDRQAEKKANAKQKVEVK